MALVTRFVNTGSTAGGDGTTNATSGDNRAYASLNEWEAAEQTDLVTDTDTHLVHCEGSVADTAAVTINGWTTGASNDITVQVDEDVRHDGTLDTSAYRLSIANANVLSLFDDHINIIGLQLTKSSSNANDQKCIDVVALAVANRIQISNCVVWQAGNNTYSEPGIWINDANAIITIWNCVAFGSSTVASSNNSNIADFSSSSCTLYNNTLIGGFRNIRSGGNVTATNNICANGIGSATNGTFAGGDYNSTDDSSLGTSGANDRVDQTFTFVDAGAGDYHLASGDGGALDFGLTDPGSGLFSDDIDSVTRSGTWDIGADEFVASGTTHDATATVAMVTTTVAAATESTNATATVAMVSTTVAAATESTNATATVAMVTTTVAAATESTNATATVAMVSTTTAAAAMTSNSIAAVAWVTTTVASLGSFDDDIVAFTVGIQQLDSGIFTIQQLNANTVGVAQVKPFTVGV